MRCVGKQLRQRYVFVRHVIASRVGTAAGKIHSAHQIRARRVGACARHGQQATLHPVFGRPPEVNRFFEQLRRHHVRQQNLLHHKPMVRKQMVCALDAIFVPARHQACARIVWIQFVQHHNAFPSPGRASHATVLHSALRAETGTPAHHTCIHLNKCQSAHRWRQQAIRVDRLRQC